MARNNFYPVPPAPADHLLARLEQLKTITWGNGVRCLMKQAMQRNIHRDDWNGQSWDDRQAHKRRMEYRGPLRYNSQGRRLNDEGEECSDVF
jgi:hypothetical protein